MSRSGGTLRRKNCSRSKSSEKFFLSPIFVFCRISLSDPYSTPMPNFKCQNNLKDPKRAVERLATFYSLLMFSKYNKRGMGGVYKKQLKKKTARDYCMHSTAYVTSLTLLQSTNGFVMLQLNHYSCNMTT